MSCGEMITDNRFEIIAKAKQAILDGTNIETDEDEMKVLDNILFRCWQMGWLDKYDDTKNQTGWIPCSERLPEENEYVGNVCKYYLIQDEYGDMHVAHLSGRGWETIESVKALGCDVVAWMPLPKPYREDGKEYELATEQMEHDALYEPTYNSEDGSM